MKPFETSRLRIRELAADADAAFMLEVLNEAAFIRNVGDRGVRAEAAASDYIRDRIAPSYQRFGFGMWLVEVRETREPIGICGLLKRDTLDDVDIGFSFFERFWSRGFAFEAASAVMEYGWKVAKLSRIVAITVPHNSSSIRLLEKLGMRFEKMVRLTPDAPEVMLFATAGKP
jgi:RimJ/RimL family protein N-acetyltransferase